MMKQLGLAGFSLLLLVSVAGCEKVEKCTRGEPGCLGGPTDDNDECAAGLESRGGQCVEPDSELPSYCDDAEEVPETTLVPPSCTPRMSDGPDGFGFAELCRRRCLQQCRRAEVICEGFECDRDCSSVGVLMDCVVDCPTMDTACLTASCQGVQKTRCESFTCPADNPRNCDDVKCSDSCTGNTDDTFCDDGDPSSAVYSLCAFGTDCSDCGPRRGSRPPLSPLQGLCPGGRDVACEDYDDDYTQNGAFCVHVEGTQAGQFSCVPDCTSEDEECDDGFECQALVYMNGDPYEDLNNVQGYACFPMFCGQ
jgi:hypothetical protein